MWKEFVKNILLGLISNTIFQIILLLVSSSGLFYTIPKIPKHFKDSEISISVLTLLILIFSCMFITASIILLIINHYQKNKIKKEKKIEKVPDYYFTNYEKYVTIYNNGNGIIIHRFTVVANDVTKLNRIRRKLNIEDGNKFSTFPEFEKMLKTKKSERFNDYGFWYYSEDGIISDIKEYYWENGTSKENKKSKANTKEIRWIFKINKNTIKNGKPYEIAYVISVPGLAALENGKLNKDLLLDINEVEASSNMSIDHKIQKLKYTISFEDGISLQTSPECRYIIKGQDESKEYIVDGEHEYDLLYNKYIFKINNPAFGSDISISWKYDDI